MRDLLLQLANRDSPLDQTVDDWGFGNKGQREAEQFIQHNC